jgi:hypothetical protein
VTPEALTATLGRLSDEDLLRTAFVLEDTDGLDEIVALLADERFHALVDAARKDDLEQEGRELLAHLSDKRRAIAGLERP